MKNVDIWLEKKKCSTAYDAGHRRKNRESENEDERRRIENSTLLYKAQIAVYCK